MKTISRKTVVMILSVILICSFLPIRAAASYEIPGICRVRTDTGNTGTVKTLDYSYEGNTYLSLRDTAMILKGTEKAFSLEVTGSTVSLNTGDVYVPLGMENTLWEDSENPDIALRRNEFKVNDKIVYYYTLIMKLSSGDYDCFMMAADLAMILDVGITVPAADSMEIQTQTPFQVSPAALEDAGYFYGVISALVWDATTG